MHVYRVQYRQYAYQWIPSGRSDWSLLPCELKYVMADHSLDAVDLLRSNARHRIEVASIEHICAVDIKKT